MLRSTLFLLSPASHSLHFNIFTFEFYSLPSHKTCDIEYVTVSDGGYESDDESIWSEEDEQTTDIHNYGEHLKLFEEVVYTYVWSTKLST